VESKEARIARARELRKQDELETSQALLLDLLAEYPEDPLVLFEVGGSYDVLGDEPEAIEYYEEAIEEGLSGDDLHECLICLGNCRRVIGEFAKAVKTLETAVAKFPDNKSGHAFLALAHYNNGQQETAVRTLMELLLETTQDENIKSYADVLEFYKDNLDTVWEE
jgi:tetratricopeptide (TPR) repeat protein